MFAAAFAVFGFRLSEEPVFVDESAYIAQAYFFDLLVEGRRDDWAWLEYHGYDLPPLPKYAIGAALRVVGERPPGRLAAQVWFGNTRAPLANPRMIEAARWPSVAFGALGCLAVFALGVLVRDARVGVGAAALLMINPLYAMHARRAMSDVYAESLVLATLAVALGTWRATLEGRLRGLRLGGSAVGIGVLGGLAVLSKLSGGLGLMIVGGWTALGLGLGAFPLARRLGFAGVATGAAVVSLATFVALNPFVTARPSGKAPPLLMAPVKVEESVRERLAKVVEHRSIVSKAARDQFPHDALRDLGDQVGAVAVQGFGRFGPLGPRDRVLDEALPRYSWSRDRGALLWLPWVAAGTIWAAASGWRQLREGRAPTAWALLVQAIVATATVTLFIPLAWDRYLLPIQPGAALLGSGVLVSGWDGLMGRRRRREG